MRRSFQTIVHPTDFSDASAVAFAHALRIVLATKGELFLIHVADSETFDGGFPHVRQALALWKLMNENDPPTAVGKLGIKVAKIGLERSAPLSGLLDFLDEHPSDLIVLATHGRDGLAHWLQGSIAEGLSRKALVPTLFIPPTARGFVDQQNGELHLSRVLVPIGHSPQPDEALDTISAFLRTMNEPNAVIELMHVGEIAPLTRRADAVGLRTGDPVQAIMAAATENEVDLIAMPTAGHDGFLDALRGSTTERVLRHAPCPVLAVPA
jgi:nucleotide-binding universal stress UspA family protein